MSVRLHHICGIDYLGDAPLAQATRIISILEPRAAVPIEIEPYMEKTLTLRFLDLHARAHNSPTMAHVRAMLEFDRDAKPDDRLVIHCFAGISRSTAAYVALMAQRRPGEEAAIFQDLRAMVKLAWPNNLIIRYADRILRRHGLLVAALDDHRAVQIERYPGLYKKEHL